mmetsp:Transcript_58857/g.140379  ORF Transcript_58857/g.140379 Transcript_58857/m.140379 type:complete len:100 (+) Transcript_58857:1668-1967(+)
MPRGSLLLPKKAEGVGELTLTFILTPCLLGEADEKAVLWLLLTREFADVAAFMVKPSTCMDVCSPNAGDEGVFRTSEEPRVVICLKLPFGWLRVAELET